MEPEKFNTFLVSLEASSTFSFQFNICWLGEICNSEQGVRTEQVSKAPVAGDYPVWEVKPQ